MAGVALRDQPEWEVTGREQERDPGRVVAATEVCPFFFFFQSKYI